MNNLIKYIGVAVSAAVLVVGIALFTILASPFLIAASVVNKYKL